MLKCCMYYFMAYKDEIEAVDYKAHKEPEFFMISRRYHIGKS